MTALSPATTRRSADHVWPLRNAAGQTWAEVRRLREMQIQSTGPATIRRVGMMSRFGE